MNLSPKSACAFGILAVAGSLLFGCSANPADPTVTTGAVTVTIKNPSFDTDGAGKLTDWIALEHNEGGSYTFEADKAIAFSGGSSARIHRFGAEIYGRLDQKVAVRQEWNGKTARLSGMLKVDKADGGGGALILQAIGADGGIAAWNHMQDHRVKGSVDWKLYSVELKTPKDAVFFRIGIMLEDGGTLWADDLKLEIRD